MTMQKGWFRLWVLLALGLMIWGIIRTYQVPNVNFEVGSAWYCLPGTYSSSVEQIEDGYLRPSQSAVTEEAKRIKQLVPDSDDFTAEMVAKGNLSVPTQKNVAYFSCSSYLKLVSNIALSLLISLLPVVAFFATRWVIDGFRRQK